MTTNDPFAAATKAAYKTIRSLRAQGIFDNTAVYGAAYEASKANGGGDAEANEAVAMAFDIYSERKSA